MYPVLSCSGDTKGGRCGNSDNELVFVGRYKIPGIDVAENEQKQVKLPILTHKCRIFPGLLRVNFLTP